jgi:hypothetical protein
MDSLCARKGVIQRRSGPKRRKIHEILEREECINHFEPIKLSESRNIQRFPVIRINKIRLLSQFKEESK